MNSLIHYLDEAKQKSGSDYRTAKIIGVTRQQMSNIRHAEAGVSDDVALRLAEYLGEPPILVIAAANARRTKSPEMREKWERLTRSLVAGLALVLAGVFGGQEEVKAQDRGALSLNQEYTLCALTDVGLGGQRP